MEKLKSGKAAVKNEVTVERIKSDRLGLEIVCNTVS